MGDGGGQRPSQHGNEFFKRQSEILDNGKKGLWLQVPARVNWDCNPSPIRRPKVNGMAPLLAVQQKSKLLGDADGLAGSHRRQFR